MHDLYHNSDFFYDHIYKNSPIAIEIYNCDGKLIDVNKACLELFGVESFEEVKEFKLFDDPNIPKESLLKLKEGENIRYEVEFDFDLVHQYKLYKTSRTGKIYLDVLISPILYANESISKYVAQIIDITKRRHAEIIKVESEQKYRNLFENAGDAIYIHNDIGIILDVNSATLIRMGYTYNELIGMSIEKIDSPTDRVYTSDRIAKLVELGHISFETIHVKKDGTEIDVEVNAKIISWNDKTVIMSICRDISKRKEAENEVKKIKTRLELATKAAGVGIWEYNFSDSSLFWDEQMYHLYGLDYLKDKITIESWKSMQHPEDRTTFESKFELAMKGEIDYDAEFRIINPDGSINYIKAMAHIKKDNDGNAIQMIGTNWDITAQKNLEMSTKKLYDDLTKSKRTLEETLEIKSNLIGELTATKQALEQNIKEKNKFFSIIAHDLKSPFMGLIGLTEILSDNNDFTDSEIVHINKQLNNSAITVFKLVENLLEWAKIQQGIIDYSPKQLNFLKLFLHYLELISYNCNQKKIEVNFEISGDLEVFADVSMVNSLIRNLLTNAVKFTNEFGKVFISAKLINNSIVQIMVSDNGIGMPANLVNRLFKIDEKVGRIGTSGEQSSGIGLLLCKEFIQLHGGKIWVESIENQGTTFFFTLPANSK